MPEVDAHDIDVVMPMYNLIKLNDNFSGTSGILQQYCKDEPALDANNAIINFNAANVSTNLFKFKENIQFKQATVVQKMLK